MEEGAQGLHSEETHIDFNQYDQNALGNIFKRFKMESTD